MAGLSFLKKKSVPEPPPLSEATRTLDVVRDVEDRKQRRKKSGRTEYFGQRVSEDYRPALEKAAAALGAERGKPVKLGEMLELTLAAWEAQHGSGASVLPAKLAAALEANAAHDKTAPQDALEALVVGALKARGIKEVKPKGKR